MAMALKLAFVMVLFMVVGAPIAQAITCGQVASRLVPCIPYLQSKVNSVPSGCCNGIRGLNSAAQTTQDRQTVCNCLKTAAASIPGINYGRAATLPGRCGVKIPYKISPDTDCKSVG